MKNGERLLMARPGEYPVFLFGAVRTGVPSGGREVFAPLSSVSDGLAV